MNRYVLSQADYDALRQATDALVQRRIRADREAQLAMPPDPGRQYLVGYAAGVNAAMAALDYLLAKRQEIQP